MKNRTIIAAGALALAGCAPAATSSAPVVVTQTVTVDPPAPKPAPTLTRKTVGIVPTPSEALKTKTAAPTDSLTNAAKTAPKPAATKAKPVPPKPAPERIVLPTVKPPLPGKQPKLYRVPGQSDYATTWAYDCQDIAAKDNRFTCVPKGDPRLHGWDAWTTDEGFVTMALAPMNKDVNAPASNVYKHELGHRYLGDNCSRVNKDQRYRTVAEFNECLAAFGGKPEPEYIEIMAESIGKCIYGMKVRTLAPGIFPCSVVRRGEAWVKAHS